MKVWIDGQVEEASSARIPVMDHGLLYGDGVFEGIRISQRRIFRLGDHLRRLQTSARAIGISLDKSALGDLSNIVIKTARAFGADEGYARVIITRGDGPMGVDPTSCPTPRTLCFVGDGPRLYHPSNGRGIALVTSSFRKPAADAVDPRVKSLNYLNSVMVKGEARRQGADEGLVLNAQGKVVETSVANIFAVAGNDIVTPPPNDGTLAGITRQTVLEWEGVEGIQVAEKSLTRVDLLGADEVFLTGSGAGIVPVASLDGHDIGAGDAGGRVTAMIEAYLDAARRSLGTPF